MAVIVSSEELGRRIRELRLERRLTLRQVEEVADVSATHLSQVERGQASPTIGALTRIARALGKDASYFIEHDERQEISHQPQASRDRWEIARGVTAEALTSGTPGGILAAYRLYFSGAGTRLVLGSPSIPGDGLYYVARGALEADFGRGTMSLSAGDAVQASFSRQHRLVAAGEVVTEVLAVRTAPLEVGPETSEHEADTGSDGARDPAREVTEELGRHIKIVRASLGLTLKDIEDRGGISATHVSEIERGKASPTVVALGRIAQALGLRAAALVDPPRLPEVSAVSGDDRGGRTVQWGTATLEPLAEAVRGGTLGAHVMRLPVGTAPALTHRHEGEEWLTPLSGVAEVRVDGVRYLLLEGDSLHFRAHVTHSYANPAASPAVLLVACRPRIHL
ncbi:MAG TPA: helix-turn-helix domain-containing protein [Candidatus Eisenbacteria bacterium]|nr:helix-turn-helix domain-containing protein [Candidatus Eisenbacteria bacterium]